MKFLFLKILLLLILVSNAQDYKRTQNWYFGDSAGLSFATDPPTVLTDGAINTIEGCATISDTSGNLLFYTNGVSVWNKAHQIMDNGLNLNGNLSSTQAALIIPFPSNDSLYYIFTTDALGGTKGLQYSIANLKQNGGLGRIERKNILLQTPVCEKLTSTVHKNGNDIWLITHGWGTNSFYSYLITPDTIIGCPIINSVGSAFGGNIINAQGSLKFSGDGKSLASCVFNPLQSKIELFNFNNESGIITYAKELTNTLAPYSVEFSPSGRYLYVSSNKNTLSQYDLYTANINASRYDYINTGSASWTLTTIQRGSDNKIYVSYPDSVFLGVISQPDSPKSTSAFMFNGINILPNRCAYGLPNFISTYFTQQDLDFNYNTNCENDFLTFYAKVGSSFRWNIFKNKAILHTSNQTSIGFNFTDTGEYIVRLISGTDTVIKSIYIEPHLNIGNDTTLCNQSAYQLSIPSNHRCITWQNGADSTHYTINQSGYYFVSAYNIKGCLVSDTVKVTFATLAVPVISKSNDSLFTDSGNYTYRWYYNTDLVGSNSHQVKINRNGTYTVEITDSNGCTLTSAPFLVSGLGIQLLNATDYFSIYPVPAEDIVFIKPTAHLTIASIRLWDITGRNYNYSPTNELSVKGLAKGIYFLELTDTNRNYYRTKIIVN